MKDKSCESLQQTVTIDEIDLHVEGVAVKEYSINKDLIDPEWPQDWRGWKELCYRVQESSSGRDRLNRFQATDLCRAPLLFDMDFVALAARTRQSRCFRYYNWSGCLDFTFQVPSGVQVRCQIKST